ncbi:GNAT family N-acetyltransferase [Evansella sp. AB-P1]|uniref:GNAT family N-acetyltransferase n=1 Tax=Evansella sp. AB-P1 TaxID=3037653 RepID=UPI00241DF92F|nr:GNAT family N-acetyltransferase [Evansella sp. AB-P1]MDG5788625.1 GNAT family N-acetyltransferase [Evansella sp. AB-P1]
MAIYRITEKNIDLAKEVTKLFFNTIDSYEQVQLFLSDEKNYLVVYRNNNKIAGFAYGYELQRFDGRKNMMYMHQVEVLHEYRQKGIGKKLMEEFIHICKRRDCEKLFLITNKSNEAAVALYERLGGISPNNDDLLYSFQM